jgi:predicted NBD/HSP70 family sugar kinase
MRMRVACGIDWSERHHDVALVDLDGLVLARTRISDDTAGFDRLLEVLAEHAPGLARAAPVS